MTGVVFLAWLGGIGCLWELATNTGMRPRPYVIASAIVIGISATLLMAYFRHHGKGDRLWQVRRSGPIRRSWLRWLDKREAQTCPYCKDDLGPSFSTCPGCEACYHHECVDELWGCASLGCEGLGRLEKPLALKQQAVSEKPFPSKDPTRTVSLFNPGLGRQRS